MIMGMLMIVGMGVGMLMGVGHTVVGVLVGMGMGVLMVVGAAGNMIGMDMHGNFSFAFFLYYIHDMPFCQNIYF